MIGAIIYFILAGICLVISIFQFMEKGVCLNNAYLYASKEEREKMDKSPYYRQSAIVFLLLFLSFGAYGIYAITYTQWLLASGVIAIVAAVIYAIASGIRVNRK
ncbi:MAG: DUF3784 domain-containing protein [Lachnospiraceae bacterium]|nr:DUF3784 domain-containing protein [Lachnospiraceae bacterium]